MLVPNRLCPLSSLFLLWKRGPPFSSPSVPSSASALVLHLPTCAVLLRSLRCRRGVGLGCSWQRRVPAAASGTSLSPSSKKRRSWEQTGRPFLRLWVGGSVGEVLHLHRSSTRLRQHPDLSAGRFPFRFPLMEEQLGSQTCLVQTELTRPAGRRVLVQGDCCDPAGSGAALEPVFPSEGSASLAVGPL